MLRPAAPTDIALPTGPFPPLPDLPEGPGAPRRIGIEIEFGAMAPDFAARLATRRLGGRMRALSAAEWRIEGSAIGDVKVYLDTALRPTGDEWAAEAGVAVARQVVPIEIVTEPLPQDALPRLERLCRALRLAGAEGSRRHVVHGYGLHLNVALADPERGGDLPRIARAFALLEPWLRARDPLDFSRRVLPFTQPFPDAFVDAVAGLGPAAGPHDLFDLIDVHIASRNHGLDLLPAYAHLAPDRFAGHRGASGAVSARPAYHYRMPESRVDEPAWSLSYEWRRWWLVELLAESDTLPTRLAAAWADARAGLLTDRGGYLEAVTAALGRLAALAPQGGPSPRRNAARSGA